MTGGSSPWAGRAAAVLILGVLLWAGWLGVVALLPASVGAPLAGEDGELAARLTAMAQRRPLLEQQARGLEAALTEPGLLWSGSSVAATAAAMQARVREAVAGAGGTLRSTAQLPPETDKGLLRIGLRVEANGSMVALRDSLVRLAAITPMVLVEGLTVTAPAGGGEADGAPLFTIRLDLAGYLRAP